MSEVIDGIQEKDECRKKNVILLEKVIEENPDCKIRIKFSSPTCIKVNRYKTVEEEEYTFNGFFKVEGTEMLCYTPRSGGRTGYRFGYTWFEKIVDISPLPKESVEFSSFDQFRKQFNMHYISEELIKELWEGTSCQHGGKYNKKDFKYLTGVGLKMAQKFSSQFAGVGKEPNSFYIEGDKNLYEGKEYKRVSVCYSARRHTGRDISISYQTNISDRVFYSSEFPGCANGQYYILVDKNKILHLEND